MKPPLAILSAALLAAPALAGYVQHVQCDMADSRQNYPLRVARGEVLDLSIDLLDDCEPLDISRAPFVLLECRTNGQDTAESFQVAGVATNGNSALFRLVVDDFCPETSGTWTCTVSNEWARLARAGGPVYVRGTASASGRAVAVSALAPYATTNYVNDAVAAIDRDEADPVFGEWARTNTYVRAHQSLEPATNYTDSALSASAASKLDSAATGYGEWDPLEEYLEPGIVVSHGGSLWRSTGASVGNEPHDRSQLWRRTWLRELERVPDYSQSNAELVATIEAVAPAPDLSGYSPTGHVHDAADIASGTLAADRIPSLPASKIGSGTLAAGRIPGLPASKITSGAFADARIPANIARTNDVAAAAQAATNYTDAAIAPLARALDYSRPAAGPSARAGADASEGPTFFTAGGEAGATTVFWLRWAAPPPSGMQPTPWLLDALFSSSPCRATREGGPELPAFLELGAVPLDAGGLWETNCVPQDVAVAGSGTGATFVVCANVTADAALTLAVAGVSREFPASGSMQAANFEVRRGDPSVSVRAPPGASVSLALAVNPWAEFRHAGRFGVQGTGIDAPVSPGGTGTWTMFAVRHRYDGAGAVETRIASVDAGGAWWEPGSAVVNSNLAWGAAMPENIRLRAVLCVAGGLGGREVQRYGARMLPGSVGDDALMALWRLGRAELRALGLWGALPAGEPFPPHATEADVVAALAGATNGFLRAEADPSVGLTNGVIHIRGEAIKPLTAHQSLAPATNYADSAISLIPRQTWVFTLTNGVAITNEVLVREVAE